MPANGRWDLTRLLKGLHKTLTKNLVLRVGIVLSRPTSATSSGLGHQDLQAALSNRN